MRKILLILITLSSGAAFAAGDAGCGLGSLIISRNSKLLQLFALTTNSTFFSQGFGITSGTSNCSASSIVSNDQEKENYVQANFSELSKNIARGEGESLSTFAVLNGCLTVEAKSEFAGTLKSNINTIMPEGAVSPESFVGNVKAQIEKSEKLKTLCTARI